MNLPKVYCYRITDPQKAMKMPSVLLDYRTCIAFDLYFGEAVFRVEIPEEKLEEYGLEAKGEAE